MLNFDILDKRDPLLVLMFLRLSRRERVRLLYEHGRLEHIPLSALTQAARPQEERVS
jgi:hypothetical protein